MERRNEDRSAVKASILHQLRQRGCRITKQREILIDVILSEQCCNCKEIYYMAVKEDPDIGMATVYRMMNVLEEIGALKWRNEYRIRELAQEKSKNWKIEFSDDTTLEIDDEMFRNFLENGLDTDGHLNGRHVKRVMSYL